MSTNQLLRRIYLDNNNFSHAPALSIRCSQSDSTFSTYRLVRLSASVSAFNTLELVPWQFGARAVTTQPPVCTGGRLQVICRARRRTRLALCITGVFCAASGSGRTVDTPPLLGCCTATLDCCTVS